MKLLSAPTTQLTIIINHIGRAYTKCASWIIIIQITQYFGLKCIPVSHWRGSVSHSIFTHPPIQPNNWQAMCWVPLSKPCPPTAAPSSLHQQCSIFLNAVLPAPNDSTLLYQTTTWRTTKNGNRNVFNSCTLPGRQWKDSWPPLYCSFTWAELSMGIGVTAMESY